MSESQTEIFSEQSGNTLVQEPEAIITMHEKNLKKVVSKPNVSSTSSIAVHAYMFVTTP